MTRDVPMDVDEIVWEQETDIIRRATAPVRKQEKMFAGVRYPRVERRIFYLGRTDSKA